MNFSWSGENVLGKATNQAKSLVVAKNLDGRLEVFYIGTDGAIYHNYQETPNGSWSGENVLGKATNQAKSLVVAQNQDGRLEVFYIGTDDTIYHNYQQFEK